MRPGIGVSPPIMQWEEVDFPKGIAADTDAVIVHNLNPPTPEHIHYTVIRQGQAGSVYHDTSGTRKPWTADYILLRSSVTSGQFRLLLWVAEKQSSLTF